MRNKALLNRRQALAVGAGAALSYSLLRPVGAATNWILSSAYPDSSHMLRNNRMFAEAVGKRSNGELTIAVHGGASMFKLPETKRAVQTGQIQLGEVWLATLSNEDPLYGVEALPFLVRDEKEAAVLWEVEKPYVAKRFDRDGLVALHAVTWPGQSIFTKKPINSFAELKGTKFRVQNPSTSRLAELMGVVGVRVETADLPQAFLTGIIDGMYTSNATGATAGSWDYCKYVYETNAWYPKNITFASKTAFEALPKPVQDIVREESATAEKRGWEMAGEETTKANALLRSHGVNVLPPPGDLMTEFRKLGAIMTNEWLQTAGADGKAIIDQFRSRVG